VDPELAFGFSPCPNDTFAFHALARGLVAPAGMRLRPVLADVEELNRRALAGGLEMTKLSFHALGHVLERYALLRAGAALGRGCGPVVVARPGARLEDLAEQEIAVPGRHTTAHLLLALHLGRPPRARPMLFSQVMPRVAAGEFAAGLVIHEGRFTYQGLGLVSLLDLGQWWEQETGLPIPLGCIALRRDLGPAAAAELTRALAASVERAWARPGETRGYVLAHAQEMEPGVVDRHIALYVNRFTRELGAEGLAAVEEMLARGRRAGLLPPPAAPLTLAPAGG
jgi:1,4-dihydroxy-6-naphthoate synthase